MKAEANRRRNAISLMESQIHKSAIQSFSFLCVLRSFDGTLQSGSTRTSGLDRYRTTVVHGGGGTEKLELLPIDTLSGTISGSRRNFSRRVGARRVASRRQGSRDFMRAPWKTESSGLVRYRRDYCRVSMHSVPSGEYTRGQNRVVLYRYKGVL